MSAVNFTHFSEEQYREQLEPKLRSTFANDIPFEQPLQSSVKAGALLYAVGGDSWRMELDAVVAAAKAVGDSGFYVTVTERPEGKETEQFPNGHWHWYVPFDDLRSYDRVDTKGWDFATYSPTAKWGVLTSHTLHAIVGGTMEFVDALLKLWPKTQGQMLDDFFADLRVNKRGGYPPTWLPGLLANVFGEGKARELLEGSGLP